jgi:steroid 5-alpha reductase family enzyme
MADTSPLEGVRRRGLAHVTAVYALALAAAGVAGWATGGRSPILVAAIADAAGTVVVFFGSVLYDNSSLYDPYWSVAPIPIAFYWAWQAAAPPQPRQIAILALVAIWGTRLTGNWIARWRGLQDEDFRYVEIRGRTGRFYWPASLVSIHLMPTAWVFLGLLPIFPALSRQGRDLGPLDAVAFIVTAGAIAIEAVADLQLRGFLRTRREPEAVLDTGLWSLCRHPNYLGEVLYWWGLFLFGMAADPAWAWSVLGPLSISLLFVLVSVPWMDTRMLSRHPSWAEPMRKLPALIPWPRAGR